MTPAPTLETHRFRLLLLSIGVLLALHSVFPSDAVLGPLGMLALAGMLFALSGRRWVLFGAALLALPSAGIVLGGGSTGLAGSGYHAPFFCFAASVVTLRVLGSERADEDTIVGSLCAYLLAALAFASLFAALEATWPGSFHFANGRPDDRLFGELFYFSLVTITTLGYGDVTPAANHVLGLVALEAIAGVLFAAIVIARIVSLAASGGGRPFALRDLGASRRPGRFELLVGVSVLFILLGPLFHTLVFAEVALRLAGIALLLSALYAGSLSHRSLYAGVVLAVVAGICHWWPGGAGSPVLRLGLALELCLFGLVVVSLSFWLARERRVTRDVLLASISLYLLLGFAWGTAFTLAEAFAPGSVLVPDGLQATRANLGYYSFMTLTTTGFGDFLPGTPALQRLATLEAFVGIFYPAALVGRLVSLYQAE